MTMVVCIKDKHDWPHTEEWLGNMPNRVVKGCVYHVRDELLDIVSQIPGIRVEECRNPVVEWQFGATMEGGFDKAWFREIKTPDLSVFIAGGERWDVRQRQHDVVGSKQ